MTATVAPAPAVAPAVRSTMDFAPVPRSPSFRGQADRPGAALLAAMVPGRHVRWPVRPAAQLSPGAELTVVTFQGEFTYRVEGVRRDGDPLPDPAPIAAGGARLTLVTAEGANPWRPDHTVFVDAQLQGDPQPAAKRPSLIPPRNAP